MSQVESALQQAMQEAAKRDDSMHTGLNFDSFVTMLRSDSRDSLDQVWIIFGNAHSGLQASWSHKLFCLAGMEEGDELSGALAVMCTYMLGGKVIAFYQDSGWVSQSVPND